MSGARTLVSRIGNTIDAYQRGRGYGYHLHQADKHLCRWRTWGSGSVRTKNGAKAVGRLSPKEPTVLHRPRPSFCPQRRVLAGTQLCPGEPKRDRWSHMDNFSR